ncbi:hypothetical protein SAMN06265171_10692 [Chryseobacterium rhizoplanae]|uniref:Uncharacterized protein n=2 Tax=Chryseobacterium rhizoplanae TaxID=1609531 RepID=A0A521DTY5_9FLAO|nr:hypothetical protein SAMN06265171_10692 [Chryseobacterium rhizoplanae]
MKNFALFFILFLLFSTKSMGQIAINTGNPQATFHIDGGKDNPSAGAPSISQQLNDVAVTSTGNLGIGTTLPTQKFEIQTGGTLASPTTGFKLADGNQQDNYVLTSDTNGTATWKRYPLITVTGAFVPVGTGNKVRFQQDSQFYTTGAYIDVSPGIWKIDVILLLQHDSTSSPLTSDVWLKIKASFSDHDVDGINILTNDFYTTANRLVSTVFRGPSEGNKNGILQGVILLKNSTNAVKRYYLVVGDTTVENAIPSAYFKNIGGNEWGENCINAYPISQ